MKSVVLEDKLEYVIIDTIEIDNVKYLFLENINEKDASNPNVVIRKLDSKEKNILGLENEEEYNKALQSFIDKHHS